MTRTTHRIPSPTRRGGRGRRAARRHRARRLRHVRGVRLGRLGRRERRGADPASRLLRQPHARAAARRRPGRHLREGPRRHRARDRRSSTPAPRPSRRCSPARSTPPTSARTRRSTRSRKSNGEAIRIIAGATSSGGAQLVVQPRASPTRRRPQGQDARLPAARQHAGRGAALLAQAAGSRDPRHRHGRRDVAPHRELADPRPVPGREDRGRLGPRAVGVAPGHRGRRQGARRREDLWPDGAFVTTHLIVRTEFLDEVPRHGHEAARGPSHDHAGSPPRDPAKAKATANAALEGAHRQAAQADAALDRAWDEPHAHPRPDRVDAADLGRPRRRGRHHQEGRPARHLRPRPAQRAARGSTARQPVSAAGLGTE